MIRATIALAALVAAVHGAACPATCSHGVSVDGIKGRRVAEGCCKSCDHDYYLADVVTVGGETLGGSCQLDGECDAISFGCDDDIDFMATKKKSAGCCQKCSKGWIKTLTVKHPSGAVYATECDLGFGGIDVGDSSAASPIATAAAAAAAAVPLLLL